MKMSLTTDSPLPYSVRGQVAQQNDLTTYTFPLWVSSTFAVPSPKSHLIPKLAVCKLSSRSINGPINLNSEREWQVVKKLDVTRLSNRHKETCRQLEGFTQSAFWKHWDQLVILLETRLCQFWPRLGMCLHLNLIRKDNAQHLILSYFVSPFLC